MINDTQCTKTQTNAFNYQLHYTLVHRFYILWTTKKEIFLE